MAASLALLISSSLCAEIVTKEFQTTNIRRLEVINTGGTIEIGGSSEDKIIVMADQIKYGPHCSLNMAPDNGTLKVEVVMHEDKKVNKKDTCEVKFNISIPKTLEQLIKVGSSDVTVRDTKGSIEFKTGSGDFTLISENTEIPTLKGNTGSGALSVKGIVTHLDIDSGSGSVTFEYAKMPEKGSANIKTGSGDVIFVLPPDAKISAELRTGSGSLKNELENDPKATFSIIARTGSGHLKIKKK